MYEHVHVCFDKRVQVQAGGSKGGGINHKEDNNVRAREMVNVACRMAKRRRWEARDAQRIALALTLMQIRTREDGRGRKRSENPPSMVL